MINYNIEENIENNRYLITFKFIMPELRIKHTLNFRMKSITYRNGSTKDDPIIPDSSHVQLFSQLDFNKERIIKFNFNLDNLREVKSITFGFCNETVIWYRETFVVINVKHVSQEIEASKIITGGNDINYNKVCMLSTWNIKCGISQYAKNFYNALINKNYEVTVMDNNTHIEDIFNFITKLGYGIFIVQYEAAIIKNMEKLIQYTERIKQYNPKIKIFFVIHSENQSLGRLDGKIDGFICHKDLKINVNRTQCYRIPMGVPVFNPNNDKGFYRKKYNLDENSFIVSTVGFMFTWKQHATFLSKMVGYLKTYDNLKVQLLTSFHSLNNRQCVSENDKIKNIINENKLQERVIHITDYLPQEELNERLFLSDLGFLWSGIETTSSSAALKEFVSSRLPLVKTNSNHLHDINQGCITVSKDMDEFVKKIIETYNNREILNKLKIDMEEQYNKLNYNVLIKNFIEVFNV